MVAVAVVTLRLSGGAGYDLTSPHSNPLVADQFQRLVIRLIEPVGASVAGDQPREEDFRIVLDLLPQLPHRQPGRVEVVLAARQPQRDLTRMLPHEVR